MSFGLSTKNRRITKPRFRVCSTCRSHSQAPLCLCTPRTITDRAEGTFGRLRYCLGGDRPSQTAPLTLSLIRIHGSRLEFQQRKGGISRTAPGELAPPLLSLPPILHKSTRSPLPSYSKGAQGLSVLPRVGRICTAITISLSFRSRQCGSRYAFRAGRNFNFLRFL